MVDENVAVDVGIPDLLHAGRQANLGADADADRPLDGRAVRRQEAVVHRAPPIQKWRQRGRRHRSAGRVLSLMLVLDDKKNIILFDS